MDWSLMKAKSAPTQAQGSFFSGQSGERGGDKPVKF
jgi:hypothetical protein